MPRAKIGQQKVTILKKTTGFAHLSMINLWSDPMATHLKQTQTVLAYNLLSKSCKNIIHLPCWGLLTCCRPTPVKETSVFLPCCPGNTLEQLFKIEFSSFSTWLLFTCYQKQKISLMISAKLDREPTPTNFFADENFNYNLRVGLVFYTVILSWLGILCVDALS